MLYYSQFKRFNPLDDSVISKFSYASKIVWRARALLNSVSLERLELIAKRASSEIESYYDDEKTIAIDKLKSTMQRGELSNEEIEYFFEWDGGTIDNGHWLFKDGMENELDMPTENKCSEVDALKEIIESRDSCFFLPEGKPIPKPNEYKEGKDYELFAVMALWFVIDAIDKPISDGAACDYLCEAMDALCYAEHLRMSEALIYDALHESNKELKKVKDEQRLLIEQFKKDESQNSKLVLAHQASKGGKAKAEKYQPLKELVFQLANEKKWPSRRNLAMTIAPRVIAESYKLSTPISESQAVDTITKWLRDMGLPVNI
ncbi:MAG: hypothetical protein HOP21_00105 [Methylotenera sp.]|nr:hypothetical protein [Methylotenera sp.]